MVSEGQFRADLYYRLNVVKVNLPALRERMEDLPSLAEFFLQKCALRARRRVRGISPAALTVLQRHDWPGNVRELENALERAVVLGQDEWIQPDDLPEELLEHEPAAAAEQVSAGADSEIGESSEDEENGSGGFHEAVRDAKRQIILRTFEKTGYRHTEAARLLGIHPNNLHRTVRALGLKDLLQRRGV
jgi:DNA-binding NtrC family response regulator